MYKFTIYPSKILFVVLFIYLFICDKFFAKSEETVKGVFSWWFRIDKKEFLVSI